MQFVKLATAAVLSLGFATATTAAVANEQHQGQSTQYQAPSGSSSSGAMQDRSGPSGAAGTGMHERSGATQSGPLTESSVKTMLQSQGYTDVEDVDKKGNKFTADAKKNGKSVKLNIDQSGKITEARK
jgi:hypothetical protein